MDGNKKTTKLAIPAKLTAVRMILLPLYMIFMIYDFGLRSDNFTYTWPRIIASALFLLAVIIYYVDRFVLERTKQESGFWSFIDVIADKFMIIGAMMAICFSSYVLPTTFYRHFFFWSAAVIMLREFVVLAVLLKTSGTGIEIKTKKLMDKLRIFAYILSITVSVLEPIFFKADVFRDFRLLSLICTVAAVALALYSGYDYIVAYYESVKSANQNVEETEEE